MTLLKTIGLWLFIALMPISIAAQSWIVTGSNVRMRQSADVSSAELTKLGMGTILVQQGISPQKVQIGNVQDYWYKATANGKTGWVFGNFLKPYLAAQKENIYIEMVGLRLRNEAVNFADEADLAKFLDRAIREITTPVKKAELELARLQALQRAGNLIPTEKKDESPYKPFLQLYKNTVFFNEIGGGFLVDPGKYWALAERTKNLAIGEKVAYEASQAMLGGECEGYFPCHLTVIGMTDARYLKMYPRGVNARKIGEGIEQSFDWVLESIENYDGGDSEEQTVLKREFSSLKTIIQATNLPNKASLLEKLEKLRKHYVKA